MPDVKYVSEYTHPYGMNYVKIEAVSLVTGLSGTGSDPPPTPQRAALLDEMKRRDVAEPQRGARVRQHVDGAGPRVLATRHSGRRSIRRRSPRSDSERNHEPPQRLAALDATDRNGRARPSGSTKATCWASPKGRCWSIRRPIRRTDPALATRGRILGGGVATKSRPLGLVHQPRARIGPHQPGYCPLDQPSVLHVRRWPQARRGHAQDGRIHRYRDPPALQGQRRPLHASAAKHRDQRVADCAAGPADVPGAAIGRPADQRQTRRMRLEAIGDDQAKEILKHGIGSNDLEVRFYAAEALAYLDETAGRKRAGRRGPRRTGVPRQRAWPPSARWTMSRRTMRSARCSK